MEGVTSDCIAEGPRDDLMLGGELGEASDNTSVIGPEADDNPALRFAEKGGIEAAREFHRAVEANLAKDRAFSEGHSETSLGAVVGAEEQTFIVQAKDKLL